MIKIDQNTIIDNGLQLSKNFLLEHLSSGAYHPVLAEWMPKFTAAIIPDSSLPLNFSGGLNTPLWKIVANLQSGAEGMLEGLLSAFGSDLVIRSGFLNNIPFNSLPNEINHLSGNSFDIQIKGFEQNMYGIAKEVGRLSKAADSLNLVFGNQSWIHAQVNPQKVGVPHFSLPTPSFSTSDLTTGITELGLTSIRGFL